MRTEELMPHVKLIDSRDLNMKKLEEEMMRERWYEERAGKE